MGAIAFTELVKQVDLTKAMTELNHDEDSAIYRANRQPTIIVEVATGCPLSNAAGLARQLIDKNDRRIASQHGPVGAIRVEDRSRNIYGWVIFGWKPF